MEQKNNDNKNQVPENDPSNAMDSKGEVEQSNDAKTDQDFPGYPHYPAKEDIMDQRTDSHRVDMDIENLPGARNSTGVSQRFITAQESKKTGTEAMREVQNEEPSDLDAEEDEIGVPQNLSNEDLERKGSGTDAS